MTSSVTVLHLEAGVDLEEIELPRSVVSKTNSTVPADDSALGGRSSTAAAQSLSRTLGVEARGRGLLDHLLVPPLGGAVALAEGEDFPRPSPKI